VVHGLVVITTRYRDLDILCDYSGNALELIGSFRITDGVTHEPFTRSPGTLPGCSAIVPPFLLLLEGINIRSN
jgi:hypothetical protein